MNGALSGRSALVTGGGRNIGAAVAAGLAAQGAAVAVHGGRAPHSANDVVTAIRRDGGDALALSGDLADPVSAAALVEATVGAFGGLDIVVNNAAVRPEAALEELSYDAWRRVMAICLDAAFLTAKAALPHLLASSAASIVNIGGLSGHIGAPRRAHVVAAKSGLIGLTKALAHELSPRGITVNCVSPGLIETVREGEAKRPAFHATRTNLVGRRGRPEEIADVVAFLCGPHGRFITGQTVHVNGGEHAF